MKETPLIYSITHDILGDPFWAVYDRGIAASRDCFGCEVRTLRPPHYSPPAMRRLIEEAVSDQPDGLLCTIPDVEALDIPLRAAKSAGIPLVAVNARDPREAAHRIPYFLYIGGDDRRGGRLAGRRLQATAPVQEVLCFDHYRIEQCCHAERFSGLQETIAAGGGFCRRIRIPGDDPEAALECVRAAIHKNPHADGVVTLGPPGACAVLQAVDECGCAIPHVTFDFSAEQMAGLRDGRLLAIVDSQQFLQAFLGVQTLCLYVRFGLLPTGDILTGPVLVDAANLETAERAFQTGAR